jgi:hypothetical protein
MHIDSYEFGRIVVDGNAYSNDLILLPHDVVPDWWRRHGHSLMENDLEEVFAAGPDLLVIGTGAFGRMNVPPATWEAIERAGIESVVEKTGSAVQSYNRFVDEGRHVAGAFHLTC